MKSHAANRRQSAPSLGDVVDLGHLGHYTMGDVKLERELLRMFSSEAGQMRANLDGDRDVAEWKMTCHTLKGAAMAVGAFAIAKVARALEEAGVEAPDELLAELDGHLEEFRAAFTHWQAQVLAA